MVSIWEEVLISPSCNSLMALFSFQVLMGFGGLEAPLYLWVTLRPKNQSKKEHSFRYKPWGALHPNSGEGT